MKHGTKIKNKVVATTPPDAKAKSTPKIKTGGTVRTRRVVSDDVPKRRQFQSRVGALAASRAKNESMPQTVSLNFHDIYFTFIGMFSKSTFEMYGYY